MNGLLSDLLTGIRVVKTFSREKTETKRFDSVDALMAYTPDIAKCAIIYAYDSAEIGVKSTCTALIFEEVQI